MKITRKLAAAALMGLALFATPLAGTSPAHADTVIRLASSTNTRSVSVAVAKPTTFRTDATFAEIVVGDPEVATVSPLTDRSFYVVGVRQGTTGIAIYNEARELVGSLEIEVGPDTDNLNRALKENLAGSDIKAKSANGRVVLSGKAKSPVAASKAKAIAEKFDKEMVNNVKVEASTQVQLEVRFIEAQRSSGKELGISLGGGNSRWSGATGGAVANSSGIIGATNALVSGSTPFGQVLGNLISHGANVDILIQALEERGVARRLAEPNLVALSGDTASFLAGGEFPVPVGTGDNDVKIEFKKFGVGLEFTPTVLDDGLINMRISPEVSAIDTTNSVSFGNSGIQIPGLVVRRASTTVELRDGQSFVMAGLLQNTGNYDIRKFPWLGDLPILGALFRSTSYRKNETDLVIIVTPHLVKPYAPNEQKPATPLDASAAPNDADLFFAGQAEISRAQLRKLAKADNGTLPTGHILDF
ncbi:MAG: type II and III secretion system protein family protein [Nitratireductor sp.]|nr:type II and III secretion system protein family protein [Nitratireductor sp.]MCC0019991.1 type II and III secretion system protein family protein [Nitratireductor sp.]